MFGRGLRRAQTFSRFNTLRKLSNEAKPLGKVHNTATPPPPPPPPAGSNSGVWVLLTGALLGSGYYFREDIKKWVAKTEKDAKIPALEPDVLNKGDKAIQEVKEEIKSVEQKLEEKESSTEVKVEAKKESSGPVDWKQVREMIAGMLEKEGHDDGSLGPLFVRLAWHSAGTFDKETGKGGTEGAAMRYEPESKWGANMGLALARAELDKVKAKFPNLTYSDLWSFAGTVAIEEMGGPEIKWRPGRRDSVEGENVLKDGLLPDADGREHKATPAVHVRQIFNRMGFNDQEMVALIGAHALGRCHTQNSGYKGPWTFAPTTFSNEYFRLLVDEKWIVKTVDDDTGKQWVGPEQYTDPTNKLMMLPTDMAMVWDEGFKKWTEIYAKDEDRFFKDFASAWKKLQENGVREFHGTRKYYLFGPRV